LKSGILKLDPGQAWLNGISLWLSLKGDPQAQSLELAAGLDRLFGWFLAPACKIRQFKKGLPDFI
jgi:hypothetical protein